MHVTALQGRVLAMLQAHIGDFVSGESMAVQAGVSRAAVMKAVRALRESGIGIESVPRRGHRLMADPNRLNGPLIRQMLLDEGIEADVLVLATVDSTNDEGKRRADILTRPLVIAAETQTRGRGRQGHSFFSPENTGLYMSIVIPTSLPLQTVAFSTQIMAVAAVRAVDSMQGPALRIKWVNDLYLGNKKTAGILTEAVSDLETRQVSAVVCGIGINLTTEDFPEELRDKAASLGAFSRNQLAARITAEFLRLFSHLPDTAEWLDAYRARSLVLGMPLSFIQNGWSFRGIGKRIDDQGRLVVRLEDQTEMILSSGEVSVIPDWKLQSL